MRNRYYVFTGVLVAALLGGYALMPRQTVGGGGGGSQNAATLPTLATTTIPDVDLDGKPDTLRIVGDGTRAMLVLDASAGAHTPPILNLPVIDHPFFTHLDAASVAVRMRDGQVVGLARVIPAEAANVAPDFYAQSGHEARRFRWVGRGFLTFEPHTIVPGFSAGLVMLGDRPETLRGMAGDPTPDGLWGPAGLPLVHVGLRDGRVARLSVDSPAFVTTSGVRIGAPLGDLEQHFPLGVSSTDGYVSPRYGLIATLDPDGRAREFTIRKPWLERAAHLAP